MKTGLTQENLEKSFKEFDLIKGKKTGIYENNAENRKKGRVGQKYTKDEREVGNNKKLTKYKKQLGVIEDDLSKWEGYLYTLGTNNYSNPSSPASMEKKKTTIKNRISVLTRKRETFIEKNKHLQKND